MSLPSIKLTRGVPPPESFPVQQIEACSSAVLEEYSDIILQYGPARGFQPLRALLAAEAHARESQVVIGQGSLQLLDFCARTMLGTGKVAYVEQPSYDRAITALRRVGTQVVGIPLEIDGPDLDVAEARLRNGERPVLFYVIPDFQNPSGSVLSLAKRRRLVELARQYGFLLVEDVPYRRLRYRGEHLPSLLELGADCTVQMSSFSKLVSPGMRVGYFIAPDPVAAMVAKAAEDTYINTSYFTQAIIYQFIVNGWLESNIPKLHELYRPRLDATLAALDAHFADLATWQRPDGGFFVGVTLRGHVSAPDLLAAGAAAGLELTDGRGFFADGSGDNFVRLPFCALTPDQIEMGVARLADVVRRTVKS